MEEDLRWLELKVDEIEGYKFEVVGMSILQFEVVGLRTQPMSDTV